ncbi:MAG TPA: hypothetical protein VGZ90_13920 [Puia sp.]|jgi:hypothetical protein|nr:hypothetical protein [Puia sp.]
MDPLLQRKSNWWFLIGFGLVNTIVFSFVLLCLTFICGHGLAAWHFPLAFLLALLLNYLAARRFFPGIFLPEFLRTALIILTIIVISIFISGLFYDISSDGQMYHMESAIQMKAGWNPFKKELPLELNQAIWLNHYGKGVEDPQATIYALTNRLETTKSTNFILLVASFCLSMAFLVRLNMFSFRKNILFCILLAFNPVTFYQMLNTYVDGQLASFLLCFIAVACLLYLETNRYFLILLASILVILINIKFTSLVFAGIFTAGMLLAFIVCNRWQAFKRTFFVSTMATIFAIGVVGYFPYMINIVRYHDILYPGLKVLKSEAGKFTPPRIIHKNQISKFFISFFSHTDNLHLSVTKDPVIRSKIPFTFDKIDLFNASKPYVAFMAGFGPFFSGVCLSSILIFCFWLWRLKNRKTALLFIIIACTIIISVLIISEAWYARYVPQLWFFPLILLIVSESEKGKTISRIRNILYIIMLMNISFCFASFPYVYYKTAQIKYELEQLKASKQIIPVEFTYFTSNRARFIEYDIPFHEVSIPDSIAVFMSSSSTKIIPPTVRPDLPKSLVLRTGEKIEKHFHL